MYEVLFLQALASTLCIEYIVLTIVLYRYQLSSTWHERGVAALFATGMTLPYLWFVFPYMRWERLWYVSVGELWVWLMESVVYAYFFHITWKRALLLSALCNAVSFFIGLLL